MLGRSAPLLIACGRFVPGVRFAVNVSMGLTEYPYRRFLLFSAIGGIGWAIYACVLAYWISTALADFAVASIVISGIVTTVLVAGVYWIDRRRHEAMRSWRRLTHGAALMGGSRGPVRVAMKGT